MKLSPETISIIAQIVVPVLAGLVAHWFGKRLPASWAAVLNNLPPSEVDALVVAVGTKKGREGVIRQRVSEKAAEYGVQLTEAQLDIVMSKLNQLWRAGVKLAGSAFK